MQKQKLIILFTVFVDVIGYGIVIPILPYYVGSFGASAFTITLLFASFAFFAFLSSPYLGALSDKIGRRPVLLISILSTAIGWFVFASAHSIALLFLGRIIDGAAAGNFTIAQSYLVDLSKDEKERTTNLGIITAVFGAGFTVGPVLGGALSTVSHAFPFWFAGILAFVNVAAAYFYLPETHHHRSTLPLSINPIAPLARAAYDKTLRPVYISWTLFAMALVFSQTIFALYTDRALGFDSFVTGLFFTGAGIFMAFNQAVLLKAVWLKRFTEEQLEFGMLGVLAVGFVIMGIRNVWFFAASIPLMMIAQSTLRVVIISRAVGLADPQMKGEIIGILTSIFAAMMVAGPPLAGIFFEWDFSLPFFAAAVLCLLALWILYVRERRAEEEKAAHDTLSS